MNKPEECRHDSLLEKAKEAEEKKEWIDYREVKCDDCGKTSGELLRDVNYINPLQKVSQQPHGNQTLWCNSCVMYVKPTSFDGEDNICPYHQRVGQSEEGSYLMYDEFDQNGE